MDSIKKGNYEFEIKYSRITPPVGGKSWQATVDRVYQLKPERRRIPQDVRQGIFVLGLDETDALKRIERYLEESADA